MSWAMTDGSTRGSQQISALNLCKMGLKMLNVHVADSLLHTLCQQGLFACEPPAHTCTRCIPAMTHSLGQARSIHLSPIIT